MQIHVLMDQALSQCQRSIPDGQPLPSQLSKPDLAEAIETIVRETQIPADNLKLEITESAIMERNAASSLNLKK